MKVFIFLLLFCNLYSQNVDIQKITEITNEYRKNGCNCGSQTMQPQPELKWNGTLQKAAKSHAKWMDKTGNFTHKGKGGSNSAKRVSKTGYQWNFVAENIVKGAEDEKDAIDLWIKSTGHCKNIMDKRAVEFAVARSGQYWCMVLAQPK